MVNRGAKLVHGSERITRDSFAVIVVAVNTTCARTQKRGSFLSVANHEYASHTYLCEPSLSVRILVLSTAYPEALVRALHDRASDGRSHDGQVRGGVAMRKHRPCGRNEVQSFRELCFPGCSDYCGRRCRTIAQSPGPCRRSRGTSGLRPELLRVHSLRHLVHLGWDIAMHSEQFWV